MSHSHLIDKALQLSQQILEAAQEDDWQHLAQLETDRSKMMQGYFHNNNNIDAHKTRELKILNDAIVVQIQSARQKTRDMQVQLNQGGKASRAYLLNAVK